MRSSRRALLSKQVGATVGLLLTGLGCQALVDVSQYRFDRDGGVDSTESPMPPAPDDLAEPAAAQDAGHGGSASDSVSEVLPVPPLLPPAPALDAGTETESLGGEQEPPSSGEPDLPPEEPSEPDAGLTPGEPDVPEPPPDVPEPVPDPPPTDPPPHPEHECSEVQFCVASDEIDTTDEERCIQRGCSVEAAVAECRQEVFNICGAVQPPFAFYALDGTRLELQ